MKHVSLSIAKEMVLWSSTDMLMQIPISPSHAMENRKPETKDYNSHLVKPRLKYRFGYKTTILRMGLNTGRRAYYFEERLMGPTLPYPTSPVQSSLYGSRYDIREENHTFRPPMFTRRSNRIIHLIRKPRRGPEEKSRCGWCCSRSCMHAM